MRNWKRTISNIGIRIKENILIRVEKSKSENTEKKPNLITIINTAKKSDNLGDEIIMYYVMSAIGEVVEDKEIYEVASHTYPSEKDIEKMKESQYVLVCGTNILSPQMELYSGWRFKRRMICLDNIVLISAGWWGYKRTSLYSRFVYKSILSKKAIHSCRDEQTTNRLREIGISNVLNTNCLTMWGLDKLSSTVPTGKSQNVIFTITGLMPNPTLDKKMISILRKNYKTLYFWPQGDIDLKYLTEIGEQDCVNVLERTLEAYTDLLKKEQIDYVGSRLHGGMHALHYKKRTIIIAVDNRAVEMARYSNLPVILNSEIETRLDKMIGSTWSTKITLNQDDIESWMRSFKQLMS